MLSQTRVQYDYENDKLTTIGYKCYYCDRMSLNYYNIIIQEFCIFYLKIFWVTGIKFEDAKRLIFRFEGDKLCGGHDPAPQVVGERAIKRQSPLVYMYILCF